MAKRGVLIILSLPIALFLSGCPSPNSGTTTVTTMDNGTGDAAEQQDDLFIPQGQVCSFTTSDSAYWGPNGYSLWAVPLPGQPAFSKRDVSLVKSSGNAYAGYGIIFCQYDTGNPALGETMLVVMINTHQQYSVGEVTGSTYTPYTSATWIQDEHLNQGYGVSNQVKVTRDGTGLFTLVANEAHIMTFRDGRIPLQAGGGDGYLVVISPQDSFPRIPVSVSFTEN